MKIKLISTIALLWLVIIGCKVNRTSPPILAKEFPIILQENAKDCGPICLAMLCKYYDLNIELDSLKKLSSFDPVEGTTLLGLSEACDSIGIKNLGIRVTYDKILEYDNPSIAHWDNNHYVVVYKMTKDSTWVADPAVGKIRYSREEFCKSWSKGEGNTSPEEGVMLITELDAKK
ncbi:cysteine peptidase family C39 domain-containing protein [uncultured Tenacibaculum sp.]|uniref:cysteine peptidase family C39 domain-containing protein n=1 Tax=uncultured Tenacibaculum sp. TaxID=174713 RepID=UPI00262B789B|nr:cysteine peptidase family C39 domain-containing protein [uncultured Tenacibaculum sp.]